MIPANGVTNTLTWTGAIMDVAEIGRNYAVGWGTLAMINAGLAQAKGRSRMAWFLASLLLGPIATFLIVVTDEPRPRPAVGGAGV
jgi:hypothetical protein